MTTATSRDMLEALLWRTLPGITADHVDAILGAADKYAGAAANETLDLAEGRARIADLAAQLGAQVPAVHFRGLFSLTTCRASWKHPPGPACVTGDTQLVTCGVCKRSRGYKDEQRRQEGALAS